MRGGGQARGASHGDVLRVPIVGGGRRALTAAHATCGRACFAARWQSVPPKYIVSVQRGSVRIEKPHAVQGESLRRGEPLPLAAPSRHVRPLAHGSRPREPQGGSGRPRPRVHGVPPSALQSRDGLDSSNIRVCTGGLGVPKHRVPMHRRSRGGRSTTIHLVAAGRSTVLGFCLNSGTAHGAPA